MNLVLSLNGQNSRVGSTIYPIKIEILRCLTIITSFVPYWWYIFVFLMISEFRHMFTCNHHVVWRSSFKLLYFVSRIGCKCGISTLVVLCFVVKTGLTHVITFGRYENQVTTSYSTPFLFYLLIYLDVWLYAWDPLRLS